MSSRTSKAPNRCSIITQAAGGRQSILLLLLSSTKEAWWLARPPYNQKVAGLIPKSQCVHQQSCALLECPWQWHCSLIHWPLYDVQWGPGIFRQWRSFHIFRTTADVKWEIRVAVEGQTTLSFNLRCWTKILHYTLRKFVRGCYQFLCDVLIFRSTSENDIWAILQMALISLVQFVDGRFKKETTIKAFLMWLNFFFSFKASS